MNKELYCQMIDALKSAYEMLDEAIECVPSGRQRVETINSRNMVMNVLIKAQEAPVEA